MPQLSPMSWILVFGILLICVVLFMVSIWWGVVTEYKVICGGGKVGETVGRFVVKWGFGKKFGLNGQNKLI
uniref:ATP synthase F0 subunit 8 n=1 Tax=Lampsilis cardium TaxID=96914 RepID=A0A3B8GYX5_LAMCD|nr:ATP synthase F0 subunit 8 [Lampsilis cardium]UZC55534.1 ATP synthase subunit 8 [Lampsilis cardium]UZC55548.1 ATP synthase subunit 8 [Lampsilis cardium]DAB41866.1 TPA_asm: ATP synthase F0 subunit 8 [Lampsilis cardium]